MGFAFVSGSAALDLVGTVTWRRADPTELLTGPADLARWLDACADLPDGVTVTPEVLGRGSAEHWTGDLYLRRLSPYLTRVLLPTRSLARCAPCHATTFRSDPAVPSW